MTLRELQGKIQVNLETVPDLALCAGSVLFCLVPGVCLINADSALDSGVPQGSSEQESFEEV
ncbi:hypothetical protein BADSM9389_04930 [Buttiauxella agrestis]|jgi:hypothetical protein|nr:hypothetical protein BADSM9389_04930 [Buttiauxella agrestis]